MQRYCQLWKPLLEASEGRIAEYSGGVIVASTSQAWTSCSMILLTPGEHLEGALQLVARDRGDRRAQLVQHQLHPQLAGLVLDDEQHLVVRAASAVLRAEHRVEVQVVAVAHVAAEVDLGALRRRRSARRRRRASGRVIRSPPRAG